ncbi:hypothetical protein NHX12_016911 [Muraenolepis orangiensis]|uniref:Vigilin N-terminal KH domain-containing protein n=1 Tax=Muraenolepis orangiensis TaxID=630683 RepID=A0A9Q0D3N0_9TELE|nr:hypothetical protein NHX12_016911 [Muraenolepis orangiensis]
MLGQWAVWHGEEAKVCLDIMQRTGAHIELSLAKDQGLSIMVTSKLDSVMKARKDMVARLQTQVSVLCVSRRFRLEHTNLIVTMNYCDMSDYNVVVL